jgi:hypothetical protein
MIEKAKGDCWDKFIDTAEATDLWTAHRYLTSEPTDGGATRIPTLCTKDDDGNLTQKNSNEEKSRALYETFFPKPSNAETPDDIYPEVVATFRPITKTQIEEVIDDLKPFKAPGPDGIPNCVFKQCRDLLIRHLLPMYRATFKLRHYPADWKASTTIVLRKPERPDYTATKAYRPIALLNVISKILSACVANDLNKIAEKHRLLPDHHFGGRAGRTTTDSMHTLTSYIKDAWSARCCCRPFPGCHRRLP